MALTRKDGTVTSLQSANQLPEFDLRLPEAVIERFPELKGHQEALLRYHENVKRVLTRLFDEQNRSKIATDTAVEALQAAQDELQASVAELSSVEPTTQEVDLSGVYAALAAHAAETATHGVASNIVGETEAQALENKSIGLVSPGSARFKVSAVNQTVANGDTITIPYGTSAMFSGLTVNGRIVVDGRLVML